MAIILEVSLTLNPGNQIAYLADDTNLIVATEYVITGTHLVADTRFTYHGNLDIVLSKQPISVPTNNYVTPVAINTVPSAAVAPPTAKYVYAVKNQLNAAGLNTDLGLRVLRSGDTMTGPLTLSGDPGVPLGAATKQYVDALRTYTAGAFLPLTGGTLSGRLTVNDSSSYPISIVSPNGINCSISYLVTGVRQWAVGISGSPGNFYIQDITAGGAIRFQIDTAGNVAIQGALNVPGVLSVTSGINVASTGITYTSYEGHSISFGWASNSRINVRVDGNFIGAMALTSDFGGYLPLTGGTLSGSLVVNGQTNLGNVYCSGGVTCVGITNNGNLAANGTIVVTGVATFQNNINCGNITSSGFIQFLNGISSGPLTVSGGVSCGNLTSSGDIHCLNDYGGQSTFTQYAATGGGSAITAYGASIIGGSIVVYASGGGNGYKPGGGSWADNSDRRLKKNVVDYTAGLAEVSQLIPKSFEFNGLGETADDGRVFVGLIADDVKPIMPEMIGTREVMLNPKDADPTEILTLEATALMYALVNSVKELSSRVAALEVGGT